MFVRAGSGRGLCDFDRVQFRATQSLELTAGRTRNAEVMESLLTIVYKRNKLFPWVFLRSCLRLIPNIMNQVLMHIVKLHKYGSMFQNIKNTTLKVKFNKK